MTKRGEKMPPSAKRIDAVDQYIGQRVRVARLRTKLSQTEVGAAVGVTFQQIQKYEKGVNRISGSRLQSLANLFGVPLMFFYEGQPTKSDIAGGRVKDDPCHELGQTRTGLRIATAAVDMTERMQTALMHLSEAIVAEGK